MMYKVVGSRRVAHVAPGGEVSEVEIAAAGGSVPHLIASGHIAPVVKASKKAASFIPADEADTEENI
jgi:poly(3-hydroxyalkanoate) synthetase